MQVLADSYFKHFLYSYNVEVTFQFSEANYRAMEGPGIMMPLRITRTSDVFIATNVTFMIIPLTVDQALQQGVIDDFEPHDNFNPNRAGNIH